MMTLLRAAIGYLFLTLMVRALTRRPGAQMTQIEFVLVFLMGGIIILATVGQDKSLTNCTCAVIWVGCLHRIMSSLRIRFPRFQQVLDGTPVVLIRKGEWQEEALHGMHLAHEDVLAFARSSGIPAEDEIEYAVLERNGSITVLTKEE